MAHGLPVQPTVPVGRLDQVGRGETSLPGIARNDPNNIFNALTNKMRDLELNQSLINNWLTLWQNQTTKKMKTANATQEEGLARLRGVQTNVTEVH